MCGMIWPTPEPKRSRIAGAAFELEERPESTDSLISNSRKFL